MSRLVEIYLIGGTNLSMDLPDEVAANLLNDWNQRVVQEITDLDGNRYWLQKIGIAAIKVEGELPFTDNNVPY